MLVNESTGLKTQILGSDTYAGLGKPLSPPVWDSRSIYFLADVNYEQGVVRIQNPLTPATRTVTVFRFTWVDKFQYVCVCVCVCVCAARACVRAFVCVS
jgi:hypothetical protein